MNIDELEKYFLGLIEATSKYCSDGTPLPFVLAAAFIDYLSKLVAGKDDKSKGYRDFIKHYLAQVRPEYQTFVYRNGKTDLSDQMYSVLRCGLVHSFSLTPDRTSPKQTGRLRSIALCHWQNLDPGDKHLMAHSGPRNLDAALFVLEDFLEDLAKVVRIIFSQARADPNLKSNIEQWVRNSLPILGGF